MSDTTLRPSGAGLRVAYLNTRYPALSHTFIQREIEGLRAHGAEVATYSIRRPSPEELGRGADSSAIDSTTYILEPRVRFLLRAVWSMLVAPLRAIRTHWTAQQIASAGLRERCRHVIYALEGMVLARLLQARQLRDVHVHMANNGAAVALLAATYDSSLRYALTIHGSAEFFDVVRLALRQKVERATFVRFISQMGRAQIMSLVGPRVWERLHVVHCGVDLRTWRIDRHPQSPPFSVLAVGRLAPIKGYPVLLEAIAQLHARGVPCTLRLVGDGPDRASLRSHAEHLGVAERVELLGPLAPARIADELTSAHVLVVSSFMEGIPVVLMEAMAAGVPVVSTRVGGVPELIEDGATGLLVDPGSPTALAEALERVYTDPQGAERRTVAARTTIEREFDVDRTSQQSLDLLRRYCGPETTT